MLTIDREKRTINIPTEDKIFGVESDDGSHTVYFSCPADLDPNFSLKDANLYINYQTPNGDKDQYIVTDKEISLGECKFSWIIQRKSLQYKGSLKFILCAKIMDGDIVKREWNTTLANGTILEGLEPENVVVDEETKDVILQLLNITQETSEEAVQIIQDAKEEALKEINEYGLFTLDTNGYVCQEVEE